MRTSAVSAAIAAIVIIACGESSPPPTSKPPGRPPTVAASAPPPPAALLPSIEQQSIDPAVNPCDDFYAYACGGWMSTHPIPADRGTFGRGSEIHEQNLVALRTILERDAAGQGGAAPYARKLGDYYSACMDEHRAEDRGPLDRELARVAAIKDAHSLAREVAHITTLGSATPASTPFLTAWVGPDFKDATREDLVLWQAGLGLPDRDYYFDDAAKPDAHKHEVRVAYRAHIAAMFELAGEPGARAKHDAETVLAFETKLAAASMNNVDLRDPINQYHWVDRGWLDKDAPGFAWQDFFAGLGAPKLTGLNVAQPEFVKTAAKLAGKMPLADARTYLRWWVLHTTASTLGRKLVDEDFRFQQTLGGAKELAPRWKRCVGEIEQDMGEAIDVPFVRDVLGAEGKARANAMLRRVLGAIHDDLGQLAWMDDATKTQALAKVAAIAPKIGYPDTWRSYDALDLGAGSYFDAVAGAATFELRRQLAEVGTAVDRSEWNLPASTVDAYYRASQNDITFFAGILQPPFFGAHATAAMEYGAIGTIMGHEITHGFDDQGRKFDAAGNNRDWWTPSIAAAFETRASCLRDQYGAYTVLDGVHVNGKLTAGENIADLGGMKLAWRAFQAARPTPVEASTYAVPEDKQFFIAYAQAWCRNLRPEALHTMVSTDPHAPPQYRVNGVLANTPEFARVFACKQGSKMAPAQRCDVW